MHLHSKNLGAHSIFMLWPDTWEMKCAANHFFLFIHFFDNMCTQVKNKSYYISHSLKNIKWWTNFVFLFKFLLLDTNICSFLVSRWKKFLLLFRITFLLFLTALLYFIKSVTIKNLFFVCVYVGGWPKKNNNSLRGR